MSTTKEIPQADEPKKPTKKSKRTCKKRVQLHLKCKLFAHVAKQNIDIKTQNEIFRDYHSNSWSEKTQYLRSIVKITHIKENFDPIILHNRKQITSKCYLKDSNGIDQKVCLKCWTQLLQINRKRLYRTVTCKGIYRKVSFVCIKSFITFCEMFAPTIKYGKNVLNVQ